MKYLVAVVLLMVSLSNVQSEEFTLNTEDGFALAATLLTPADIGPNPAVILIHQGGSNRSEWSFFHEQILSEGYVLLSYDIRGMGASPKEASTGKTVANIYNAPDQATLDLEAAITLLETREDVDSDRIAIVGASVGGNLAVVGAGTMNIKTAVAISGKTDAVLNLAGDKNMPLHSTYYISSMESDGARTGWAREMYDMTEGRRKISIIDDSLRHGVSIFKDAPELKDKIIQWLRETL